VSLYRVTLAYDGTDFLGWQLQRPGRGRLGGEAGPAAGASPARGQPGGAGRTVQGVLEDALARLAGGARVVVAGAGRTDAGVHALGQVAAFSLPRDMDAGALHGALNALLPPDVRVLEAAPAPPGFHPRRSALSKLYRYELDCGGIQIPQRRRFAGFSPRPLDEAAVRRAAVLYLGSHDFASLASAGGSAKTTVRTVTRSQAALAGSTLVYEVEADGFLRKMVRSMVGGLIAAGRGARSPEDLARSLEARDRRAWPAPAPACGLTLVRVLYPPGC
jgi:tRNA pseudouridine38-40 synthase